MCRGLTRILAAFTVALIGLAIPAVSQELTLKTAEAEPPGELAAEFRELLDAKSIQLAGADGVAIEFWFRKDIPVSAKPADNDPLASLKEPVFIGACKVSVDSLKDFRDDDIAKGVYTLRFGLQPVDGDHLGTAPFRYFAVLVPAQYDTGLDAIKDNKTLSELSGQDTYDEHPNNLSVQPLEADQKSGEFPRLGEGGEDWKFIYLKLPAKVDGTGEPTELSFGLVYEGHGHL